MDGAQFTINLDPFILRFYVIESKNYQNIYKNYNVIRYVRICVSKIATLIPLNRIVVIKYWSSGKKVHKITNLTPL